MINDIGSFLKRSWKAIGGITGLAVFIGAFLTLGSNVATLLTYLHIEPHSKVTTIAQAHRPAEASQTAQALHAHAASATTFVTQSSNGIQSSNINGVKGSVDLRYGTAPKALAPQPPPDASHTTKLPSSNGVVQISSGNQSPNISDVGGDLKLNYDSQPASTASQK